MRGGLHQTWLNHLVMEEEEEEEGTQELLLSPGSLPGVGGFIGLRAL